LLTPGSNTNQKACDILRKEFPELDAKIPLGEPGNHSLKAGSFRIDNSTSREVLGVTYREFDTTIVDTATSLLEIERGLTTRV
jgi:hypothetical protein